MADGMGKKSCFSGSLPDAHSWKLLNTHIRCSLGLRAVHKGARAVAVYQTVDIQQCQGLSGVYYVFVSMFKHTVDFQVNLSVCVLN